jgi:aquaporin related protein
MHSHNTRTSFAFPRTPPAAPKYDSPRFEKHDKSPSIGGNGYSLWISHSVRNHIIAMLGEFIGTLLFLFFSLAAAQTAKNKPDTLAQFGSLSAPSLL